MGHLGLISLDRLKNFTPIDRDFRRSGEADPGLVSAQVHERYDDHLAGNGNYDVFEFLATDED